MMKKLKVIASEIYIRLYTLVMHTVLSALCYVFGVIFSLVGGAESYLKFMNHVYKDREEH